MKLCFFREYHLVPIDLKKVIKVGMCRKNTKVTTHFLGSIKYFSPSFKIRLVDLGAIL